MMYCVELRDFTTGEQRAMCIPKVVVAEEVNPFGVVHDIPYFSFDLDRFDYISEDCCFLRVLNKKSDWRSIMDILATGKYYRYNDKVYIYKSDNKWYCYRITDVDKFDLLYTKLQVFRKEE